MATLQEKRDTIINIVDSLDADSLDRMYNYVISFQNIPYSKNEAKGSDNSGSNKTVRQRISKDDLHEGIIEFRNKINKWREKKEIQFVEIIDLYNYMLSFDNKYLSKIQIDEIKK